MVSNLNEYRIKKQFQSISSLVYQIVEMKQIIKMLSPSFTVDYHEYQAKSPAGVDERLLRLIKKQQSQRLQLLIDMRKRKNDLRKILRQLSRELGETCRYEYLTDMEREVAGENI